MNKRWIKQVMPFNRNATVKATANSLLLAALLLQLGGCQTHTPLKEDSHVGGRLNNPTEATQVEGKIDNINERDAKIKDLLAHAQMAWENENFDQLQDIYARLEDYDPGNLRAKEGFIRIEIAKKHQDLIKEAEILMGKPDADGELAMAKLHEVLLENSHHSKAQRLYNSLLQVQENKRQEKLKHTLTFNEAVTMEFRDVNIQKVFEALSKTTNINFILDKGVPADQKATIFVKSMAFQDAFNLLLQSNKLAKKVLSDNSVIVYVNNTLNKREYQDLVVRNFVLDYADAKLLSVVLRSMLNINKIEVNERLNTLMIRDSIEVLALAEKIIQAQDFPDAEVMLEVQVLEMKRSYVQNLGVTPPTGVSVPVPTSGVLTVKDLKVSGNSLVVNGIPGLVFNATDGDVTLLANPRIRVKNKESAKIHIGEKVPVFTSNVASTGVSSQTVQYIDAGLKLEMVPVISPTGDVTIKVDLNVGSIGDAVTATTGNSQSVAFRVGTRLTSTILRLHDGETQILAGLIDDQDRKTISGLPGLSKVPLLGRLFSTQSDDKIKTEIVLSITPHIIRERRLPTSNQAEMWIGSEGKAGRQSPSPLFQKGASPFFVPKPKPTKEPAPDADKPKNINIPLPPGFSLGDGLPSQIN
ncbi:MAG: type II secretion system protein GspD [Methylophilaceae bacterium]